MNEQQPAAPAPKPKRPLPKSRLMVNAQTAKCYEDAWNAKKNGQPIGWSTGVFPPELCETFGVPVLYPENNAASLSAKHYGDRLVQHAEGQLRYPQNICSYARLNIALADVVNKDGSVKEGFPMDPVLPLPDFLLLANNSCTQLMKWYEQLARTLDIPIFFLDCLFNYDDVAPANYKVEYVRSQLEEIIAGMEKFFGKKFDWDRFREAQARSVLNSSLFAEIGSLNERIPAPLSGFDFFNYMAPLVLCRAKESTTDILLQLKSEVEEHIAKGTTTFPAEEEYRVHWEGIACWPNLGYTLRTMKNQGVNAVMNGYIQSWNMQYKSGDLDSMARAYIYTSTNSFTTAALMEKRAASIEKFGCEGFFGHINHSCKLGCFNVLVGREMIERKCGIPVGSFDGDQSDSRIFSEAQYMTRLQSLVEIMNDSKEKGAEKENG